MRRVTLFGFFGLLLYAFSLHAAVIGYNFQQYQGNGAGGPVGDGMLLLSNNNTTVKANLIKGVGSFVDNLVIYIDSTPGGFTTTSSFSDKANGLESSVSGYYKSRSIANFAPGFEADYAVVLGINSGSAVYKLVSDSTGSHLQLVRNGLNFVYIDSPNHPSYSFQFDWADIGLPSQNTNFFKFESSYLTATASRTLASYEGLVGTSGFGTVTFTNYDTYGVPPVPENTNAALAAFVVVCGGFSLTKRVMHSRRQTSSGKTRALPPS